MPIALGQLSPDHHHEASMTRRFRANPGYALIPREQQAASNPESQTDPPDEPLYGYLQPKPSSHLSCRQISPETALLFLTLQHEGPVPEYFRSLPGGSAEKHLLRLVLDEVLEVEHEGSFVSGAAARAALFGDRICAARGPLAELSIEGLRYAEALGSLAVPELAHRLYNFGRRPVSSARKHGFSQAEAEAHAVLDRYWHSPPLVDGHWTMWRPILSKKNSARIKFKLYISPDLRSVSEAFRISAETLAQCHGVRGMKLGRGLPGLTRPDKLVAYFSRMDDLQEAGLRLAGRLEGCPVHGVPFTAQLSSDGLLSWGADPPRAVSNRPASWRFWLAVRIAAHFAEARRNGVSGPLWHVILDRLRLDGVDPDSWAPKPDFWSSPPAAI